MKNYILTMDVGGTTFTSALFDDNLNQLAMSNESYINNYSTKLVVSHHQKTQNSDLSDWKKKVR